MLTYERCHPRRTLTILHHRTHRSKGRGIRLGGGGRGSRNRHQPVLRLRLLLLLPCPTGPKARMPLPPLPLLGSRRYQTRGTRRQQWWHRRRRLPLHVGVRKRRRGGGGRGGDTRKRKGGPREGEGGWGWGPRQQRCVTLLLLLSPHPALLLTTAAAAAPTHWKTPFLRPLGGRFDVIGGCGGRGRRHFFGILPRRMRWRVTPRKGGIGMHGGAGRRRHGGGGANDVVTVLPVRLDERVDGACGGVVDAVQGKWDHVTLQQWRGWGQWGGGGPE